MTATILAIRPEPGNSSTLAIGAKEGLTIRGYPLFEIEPVAWQLPNDTDFNALLAGSANVFRHGGSQLQKLRHVPVHAVGKATAEAAREAGFEVTLIGTRGLQSLVDVERDRSARWLRLAGEEHVELDVPDLIDLTTCITYRVQTSDMPEQMRADLRSNCIVLLHSAAAARHFAFSCNMHDIERGCIALAALGPRILEPVGSGWREARAALQPSESALMALAKEMCETI